MNEALKKALEMLDSKILTESVQTQISEAFDKAVEDGVDAKIADLKESAESNMKAIMESKLDELKEKFEKAVDAKAKEINESEKEKLVESIDMYLEEVKDAWLAENKVNVQAEIDVKKAESILEKVAEIATILSVDLHEITQTDIDAKKMLDESVSEKAGLKEEILTLKKEKLVSEACKDLTVEKADRLEKLSESIETKDLDKFKSQLETFKETLIEGVVDKKPSGKKEKSSLELEY